MANLKATKVAKVATTEVVIKLTREEQAIVNRIKKNMDALIGLSLKGLEKAILVGRDFIELRQKWDDRLSALYREQGKDWKAFVASTLGYEYSRLTRFANCARIKDGKADVFEAFLADAKDLGYATHADDLLNFANGAPPKSQQKAKTPPADVIRFNGLEARFKDGKFAVIKGDKKKVEALIKYLQGELKNM